MQVDTTTQENRKARDKTITPAFRSIGPPGMSSDDEREAREACWG